MKEIALRKELQALANKSAPCWEGLSLDGLEEYIKGIDPKVTVVFCSGDNYNRAYNLTGNNRYPWNLTLVFLDIPSDYSLSEMMKWKLQYGARWADDVRDNNLRREGR